MTAKLPRDAFAYYLGLGTERSYKAVADHYGVTKRAVTALATKEEWQERVEALEREAMERVEKRALETLEAMNERHLKSLRVIQGKALEALKAMPLKTAMDAVRALDLAIKQERTIRGEPGERTAVSIEDVVRREYDRWFAVEESDDETT